MAEALRWVCHVAGLVAGPAGPPSSSVKLRVARGAAAAAVGAALETMTAAGQDPANRSAGIHCGPRSCPQLCPYEKALAALDFTLRAGFGSLAIPSKLVGVREHQRVIRRLKASGARFGSALRFVDEGDRLAVAVPQGPTRDEAVLGYVQSKHEPWVRALLGQSSGDVGEPESLSLGVCLLAVTGDGRDGRLHGVNIAFVRVSAG